MRFMKLLEETPYLTTEDVLEWDWIRGHDVDRNAAFPQRGRHFESDETCTHEQNLLCGSGFLDECAAVGKGAKVVKLRSSGTGNGQSDRVSPGRQQECIEGVGLAILELNALPLNVQQRHP